MHQKAVGYGAIRGVCENLCHQKTSKSNQWDHNGNWYDS